MFSQKEREQEINEVFAANYDIAIEQINDAAKEEFEKLNPDDFESEDARWGRALRRARGGFKAIAKSMKNAVDGMIVCRFRDQDFARSQYNQAKRLEAEEGLESAIKKGYMNKDGQPVYHDGKNKGKVIIPSAFGSAMGYFVTYDGGERIISPKYINIAKKNIDDKVPICQPIRISGNDGKEKKEDFPYSDDLAVWYNASTLDTQMKVPYNEEEVGQILSDWNRAFGNDIPIIASIDELRDFNREHCSIQYDDGKQYDICYVPARVVKIIVPPTLYDNVRVTIEFLDYNTYQDETINVFLPANMVKGLPIQEDRLGICVLQAYEFPKTKDNVVHKWHLGGFLPVRDDVQLEKFCGIDVGDGDV